MAALLWYNQLKSDLISIGFKFNPYDPCVANRNVGGKQQTACFHVDDLKSSTLETPIHDEFAQWLEQKYGSVSPVKVHRGKVHEYLGMTFDYSKPGKVIVDMRDYVNGMPRYS